MWFPLSNNPTEHVCFSSDANVSFGELPKMSGAILGATVIEVFEFFPIFSILLGSISELWPSFQVRNDPSFENELNVASEQTLQM